MSLSRFDRSQIKETLRHLRQLADHHDGTPGAERISALALLKGEPGLTLAEAADRLGTTERTVQRWLKSYRKGGIDQLITAGVRRGRPKRLDPEKLQALRKELESSSMHQLTDIRDWLKSRFGLELSVSGTWNVLRRDVNAAPRGWVTVHDEADRRPRIVETVTAEGISTRVIDFLNALPTTAIVKEWIEAFREALGAFFGDVDRVSVNVDLNFDLANPDEYQVTQRIVQNVPTTARGRVAISMAREEAETPSDRLLQGLRRGGFPLQDYYKPVCFDYFIGDGAYLGSVMLWRNRQESPISEETIDSLEKLEPFIRFALSDIIARNKAVRPIDAAFTDALNRMNADAELSAQEKRIVILQLMGHSYKEMADVLAISVDGVKKHFRQIHRKTNTRSQSELFAKYFTFRIHE